MLTCSRVSLARNGTVKRELGFAGLSRHLGAAVLLPALNAALAGALPWLGHCPAEKERSVMQGLRVYSLSLPSVRPPLAKLSARSVQQPGALMRSSGAGVCPQPVMG